ncbi:MAG: hypothetical protein PHH85_06705 [Candidatus Methanoperedens sp.]|nr:hypothetical protein [Candidatus Methanoperedens sp.]
MPIATEFLKYCTQYLDDNMGGISEGVINKIQSRKNLNDTSNINDVMEFIGLLENSIGVISGKNNAITICKHLREKTMELNLANETDELHNTLRNEASDININEFLARINAVNFLNDLRPIDKTEKQTLSEMHADMDGFLSKNVIPAESEITEFSEELALKYHVDVPKIKKDIIEKVKVNFKNEINKKAIKTEINKFLFRYPVPSKEDIDDFVNYFNLLKFTYSEAQIREQIETERLYLKFQDPVLPEKISEFDQLIDQIKGYRDKNDIIRILEEKEISYLIKDETRASDKFLIELVEQITLFEKDPVGGAYLNHLVREN